MPSLPVDVTSLPVEVTCCEPSFGKIDVMCARGKPLDDVNEVSRPNKKTNISKNIKCQYTVLNKTLIICRVFLDTCNSLNKMSSATVPSYNPCTAYFNTI